MRERFTTQLACGCTEQLKTEVELLAHRFFRELFRTGLINEQETYLISRKDGNFYIRREE